MPPLRLETVRLQVLKIGARVTQGATQVRLHLASGHKERASLCLRASPAIDLITSQRNRFEDGPSKTM